MKATTAGRALPIAPWLRGYDRAWLSRDIVAGVAAGAVVVPQAMAYATTVADLPAEVGLYTCMVPMAVYALLGGSRTLSVSTTSTVAILTGSTLLAAGVAAGSDDPSPALATLTLLVGVILLIARALRLGVLIDNISEATLTGIKVGVGLTIAAGQLPSLLGIEGDPTADNFFSELRAVIDNLGDLSWTTVAFSAATIAVLVGLRRIAPQIPGPLVAVVGGILLVVLAAVDEHGVALIPPVPSGLPRPVVPSLDHVEQLLPGAFAIAIMVFLETPDRDQPARGARTQLSELVTVALAVGCALFLGGILSDLPEATLGCMVVIAVLGVIDLAAFARFWRLSRLEFWVAVVTAASGLVLGLLPAVLVGVLLTLLLVLVELDRVGLTELQPTPAGQDFEAASAHTEPVPGLLMLRFDGPLYTANVRSANRKITTSVDQHPGTEVLVLDATALAQLSITVIEQFGELERELSDRGVSLWIAALPPRRSTPPGRLPAGGTSTRPAGSTRPPSRPCAPSAPADRGHGGAAWHEQPGDDRAYSSAVAEMATIETERLVLRPWRPEDLAEFTRLLTDPVVTRYIVVHTPFSPQDVAELSARTLEQWERNGFGPWAAIEKRTGRWVGRIGLDELPDWPGPDKVEVGWELHREFWGRGLATEGGLAGVRHGFEQVGLERIISATMATNAASRRVMEKCGLRFQGELPMAGTVVAWYAIDRSDWQAGHGDAPLLG